MVFIKENRDSKHGIVRIRYVYIILPAKSTDKFLVITLYISATQQSAPRCPRSDDTNAV